MQQTPQIYVKGWRVYVTKQFGDKEKRVELGRMYSSKDAADQLCELARKQGMAAEVASVSGVEKAKR